MKRNIIHLIAALFLVVFFYSISLAQSFSNQLSPAGRDSATNTLQTIDYPHHEIHSGSNFFYTDSNTLGSGVSNDTMIITPDNTAWAHMTFMATGSAITTVEFFEDTDRTGTSLKTSYNSNRNSSSTSGLSIYEGTSGGTTNGTLIWGMSSGSASGSSREGLTASHEGEIVLKQNTKYILRVSSGTASNLTNVQLSWYEHTNK